MMGVGGGMGMWLWPALILIGVLIIGYVVLRLVQNNQVQNSQVQNRFGQDGQSVQSPAPGRDRTARQLLDERYARGEIGDDEYARRKAALREQ